MKPTPAAVPLADVETMSAEFTKFHLRDGRVLHRFTAPDKGGPHCHPWPFVSQIISGGYVERVYHVEADGRWWSEDLHRQPGDVFAVAADHIHEIIALPAGECVTLMLAGERCRVNRWWRFESSGVASRAWNESDFTPFSPSQPNG